MLYFGRENKKRHKQGHSSVMGTRTKRLGLNVLSSLTLVHEVEKEPGPENMGLR